MNISENSTLNGQILEELTTILESPWQIENHKSKCLDEPNLQYHRNHYQRATPLLDFTHEFRDCQYAEFVQFLLIEQYSDGANYKGQSKNKVRYGLGTQTFLDGSQVRGYFINDHPVGRLNYISTRQLNMTYIDSAWHYLLPRRNINGFLKIQTSEYLYIGYLKNGHFYGQGKLFRNKIQYNGQFQELYHGSGVSKAPSGEIYVGAFFQDYLQGQGSLKCEKGSTYRGQWSLSNRGGFGQHVQPDGVLYECHWVNGKKEGQFTLVRDDFLVHYRNYYSNDKTAATIIKPKSQPIKYIGDYLEQLNGSQGIGISEQSKFVGNCKNGQGTDIDAKGVIYLGSWLDGQRHGWGKALNHNKAYYEGPWQINEYHGQGSWGDGNQLYFIGSWLNHKMNGQFTGISPQGGIYVGSCMNGQKQGQGKQIRCDSSWYEGDWFAGHEHGKGVSEDGKQKYVGDWIEGRRTGIGEARFQDNTVYKGAFLEDQRHGFGTLTTIKGNEKKGQWYKDQFCYGIVNCKMAQTTFKGPCMNQIAKQQIINYQNNTKPTRNQPTNQLMINYIYDLKYVGEIHNLDRNGVGTSVNRFYLICGNFLDDKPYGLVYLVWQGIDDDFICGYFKEELYLGQRRNNQGLYIGNFKSTIANGQGIVVYRNGDFLIGNFESGLADGYGIHYSHKTHVTFEGNFRKGMKSEAKIN